MSPALIHASAVDAAALPRTVWLRRDLAGTTGGTVGLVPAAVARRESHP